MLFQHPDLRSETKVEHELADISEVFAREYGNDEDKVKPNKENIEGNGNLPHNSNIQEIYEDDNSKFNEDPINNSIHAPADNVEQEESVVESVTTTIAIAVFETKKPIWFGTSGKPRKDLIRYDAKEIPDEDDVVDAKCDDATENYYEE